MSKILELSDVEKEIVGGGEGSAISDEAVELEQPKFNMNCTDSDTWVLDIEGPLTDPEHYKLIEQPQKSSMLSVLGYGTLFFIGFFCLSTSFFATIALRKSCVNRIYSFKKKI